MLGAGVLLEVALERLDALAHGVLVQLAAELGVVEEGVLFDAGAEAHLRGLEEHATGVLLAAGAHVAVGQQIERMLRHAVVADRLLLEVRDGVVVAAEHVVAVADLVVVVLRRAVLRLLLLGYLVQLLVLLHGLLVFAAVEVDLGHHLAHLVLAEGVLVLQQAGGQLQQVVLAAEVVVDAGDVGGGDFGKLAVVLEVREVLQRQLVLPVHILDVCVVVEARRGVLRPSAHLLGEAVGGPLEVALLEVAVALLEVVLAAMVVLHLLGVYRAVVGQRLVVVGAGIVEVAQVEPRHVAARALRVETHELLEAVAGVVVVELLRAHAGIVAGVGRGEVGAPLVALRDLVVDLLRGGILLFLVQVGGAAVEVVLPLGGGLLLRRGPSHQAGQRQYHCQSSFHCLLCVIVLLFNGYRPKACPPSSLDWGRFSHGAPRSRMPLAGGGVTV